MQLEILVDRKPLPSIQHNGETFAEAPFSGNYAIRLHNNSPRRRLAVVSVDGVNVVDGTDAGHDGPGYVLDPWQKMDIKGWRRSESEVASFTFQDLEESYAPQTGRGSKNVGVVGVAVFDEKVKPLVLPPIHIYPQTEPWKPLEPWSPFWGDNKTWRSTEATEATFNTTRSSVQDVGTGYGNVVDFHTSETSFIRSSQTPVFVTVLRYATRERLISWGVPVSQMKATGPSLMANPFPVSTSSSVPPPPKWRG